MQPVLPVLEIIMISVRYRGTRQRSDGLAILVGYRIRRSRLLIMSSLIRVQVDHVIVIDLVRGRCVDPGIIWIERSPLRGLRHLLYRKYKSNVVVAAAGMRDRSRGPPWSIGQPIATHPSKMSEGAEIRGSWLLLT